MRLMHVVGIEPGRTHGLRKGWAIFLPGPGKALAVMCNIYIGKLMHILCINNWRLRMLLKAATNQQQSIEAHELWWACRAT